MELTLHDDYVYTTMLDLNLEQQKLNALRMQDYVKKEFADNVGAKDLSGQLQMTTKLYSQYNYLMYPLIGVSSLYEKIREMFHICVREENYGVKLFDEYHMQCWLNIYNRGDYINWHGHWPTDYSSWHGFYCVDVEPDSYTTYKLLKNPNMKKELNYEEDDIKIESKNNLLVLSPSGKDMHRSSEWNHDNPRITVAFDIVPTIMMETRNKTFNLMNHWVPV